MLVDSERITNTVFAKMLSELGLSISLDHMYEHFMGRPMTQCLELIAVKLGKPPPPDFEEQYKKRARVALEKKLRPILGVPEMLDELKIPYCVASSGTHDKMRTTLGITGLLSRFHGRLYSVTEVAHGKPAPDVFLYAAAQCGVEASACAVIEDTPTGVAAGVAAGMTVFGYTGLLSADRLRMAGAYYTFDDMHKLIGLLNGKGSHKQGA